MPEYDYVCPFKHTETVTEPMLFDGEHRCGICDEAMWRRPGIVHVVWNGLPPHRQDERGHELDYHLRNVDRSRDEYLETHTDDD